MLISATIKNGYHTNEVTVATEGNIKPMSIASKGEGYGSSINGGELLFLALATCFCNDTYREAAKRKMNVHSVEVTVKGHFGGEGEPASDIHYEVTVLAPHHSQREIRDLVRYVDGIAEVHNTLRRGMDVVLKSTNGL